MLRFLHTADWQVGKPFAWVGDSGKREALRRQRLETVRGLRRVIEQRHCAFVVVCGDLFDSATPDRSTVAALCSAVGELHVPVYAIPGNHDPGGPGSVWERDYLERERETLAPNLTIFTEPVVSIREDAVLLPCPLRRRHSFEDPTAWLRELPEGLPTDRPWIVLAHGSVQGFSSRGDSDAEGELNRLELAPLRGLGYDYMALGDWHGMKEIDPGSWYAGTPEQDRFARGDANRPGHVLSVTLEDHGSPVSVEPLRTGEIGWHDLAYRFTSDADLPDFEQKMRDLIATRTGRDLVRLTVEGSLSLHGEHAFAGMTESFAARLIDLRLSREVTIEPSTDELDNLLRRDDPLIASVAQQLREQLTKPDQAAAARAALRELYLQLARLDPGSQSERKESRCA